MNIFSLILGDSKTRLSRQFKGFEPRPQQVQMAAAVMDALSTNRHLMVEAGTGVGKSLAYLLPFIKWAVDHNKKAVISTHTKTLQEQLTKKDIPTLRNLVGVDFRFALCVGSQNYLCTRRLYQNGHDVLFETKEEKEDLSRIHKWFKLTGAGLRSELNFTPNTSLWNKICREPDLCLGKKCSFYKDCFYYKARREEHKAHILVANHHLFFTHIATDGRVFPPFDAVVFDEAHTLEDAATSYLGIEISNTQIKYFLDSLFNPGSGKGFLRRIKGVSGQNKEIGIKKVKEAGNAAQRFFLDITAKFGQGPRTERIREARFAKNYLKEPLSELVSFLREILKTADNKEEEIEIISFMSQAQKFNFSLEAILQMQLENHVYWIEISPKARGDQYTFHAAPIDISKEFKEKILDKIKPAIFTSATLSTNGSFEFMKKRLGMDHDTRELLLDSPFDYVKNTVLYLPCNLPNPAAEPELFRKGVVAQAKKILSIMHGRTFILFTSFKMLNSVGAELRQHLKHLCILEQGDVPRHKLLETFKDNSNAVLLGTNTFWQGIDIPGEALECVIITKLPFAVPDEPVVEAKMEFLRSQGNNPFEHYQLPRAVIMLRQGFGRLIRTQQDKGMVAILDPRIKTKDYGKKFLNALPRCRHIHELTHVEEFFTLRKVY